MPPAATGQAPNANRYRWALLGGIIVLELLALTMLYRSGSDFSCSTNGPAYLCRVFGGATARILSAAAACGLVFFWKPAIRRAFTAAPLPRVTTPLIALHAIGLIAAAFPALMLRGAPSAATLFAYAILGIFGAAMAIMACARLASTGPTWRKVFAESGWAFPIAALIGFFSLDFIEILRPMGRWEIFQGAIDLLTRVTFSASSGLLAIFGNDVVSNPVTHELGVNGFVVRVWGPCSGIEGFVLITAFLSGYIWLFRKELKLPHALLLLPIGIALSWCLNVVRISMLILLGANVSPDLAMNGFHSNAGWLMFTVLAVGLSAAVYAFGWFRKPVEAASMQTAHRVANDIPDFWDDPFTAQIVPFIVFMASAFLLSTFTQTPDLNYPIRFAAMVVVLGIFWRYIKSLDWSLDAISLGIGALIGVGWILTIPAPGESEAELAQTIAGMSAGYFVLWAASRALATTFLVPIIEELFFRGYILRKLDTGSLAMRLLAITVSTAMFAALHGRWLAAAIAGVLFALILLRRGRISDAILAHAAANGVIAIYAITVGNWAVI